MQTDASGPQTPEHLQIFNSLQTTHKDKESDFLLFPLLPAELRLQIWRCSLQRERIIKVSFKQEPGDKRPKCDGKTPQHHVIVDGYQLLSKLLRVNQESRLAALGFYRVHIPCTLRRRAKGAQIARPGSFYFSPEYDFLQIQPGNWYWAEDSLIDLLHHLINTYDPQRKALLNVAFDGSGGLTANNLYSIQPSDISVRLRESFIQTLSQLQEVFFISETAVGRQIHGVIHNGISDELIFNRSMPVTTRVPTFERLHRDPRPIAGDLRQIYIAGGPRKMLYYWQRLLKIWGICPRIQIKYQFILTTYPGASDIYDYQTAEEWVQKEDDDWTGKWRIDDNLNKGLWGNIWATRKWKNGDVGQHFVGALHEKYRDENLSKVVKPAFGFWMFPVDLDVFGKVPSSEEELRVINTQSLVDMSGHWPGLGLFSLS